MDINRHNYEAYLLDLYEGRLSPGDQQMVRDFLVLNPDCSMHLQGSEPWILEKEKVHFPGKEQLKKAFPDASFRLTEPNFDLFSIARLEGDLTAEQEMDHEAMVEKNEANSSEWRKWQLTKLIAQPVTFKWKNDLKRRNRTSNRIIWLSLVSSAAAIAILLILFRTGPLVSNPEFARETPVQNPAIEDQATAPEQEIVPSPVEEAQANSSNETLLLTDESVLFSIKKNDSAHHVRPQLIQARPIRIASVVPVSADPLNEVKYDRIKPLDLPPGSIHLSSLSLAQMAEIDLRDALDNYTEENDISLWSIANAGIKGINKITGADISLLASRDENGDLSGFRFKSKRFSVTSPLDQSE